MIYKLMEQPYKFKTLDLDMLTLLDKVGSEELALKIFQQSDTNLSLAKDWVEFDCNQSEMPETSNLQTPDIYLWLDAYPVLNKKAYDALESSLNQFGEFLNITVAGEPHFFFSCLTYGKEDNEKTDYKYNAGIPIGIAKLDFIQEDVKDKVLFKSQISFCGSLFCNSLFKKVYEENQLKGLRFEEDLLEIF